MNSFTRPPLWRNGSPLAPPLPTVRPPIARLQSVRMSYADDAGTVEVLRDVTIDIPQGVTALVGPSGQGKTTLLNLLAGFDVPTAGELLCCGQRLEPSKPAALRQHGATNIAMIHQGHDLIGALTAEQNAAFPLVVRGVPWADAASLAGEMLSWVGIGPRDSRRLPHRLSHGQRQRVAIARALLTDAPLILADEPTASLDATTAGAVMQLLLREVHDREKSLIFSTHDESLAHADFVDQRLRCADGDVHFESSDRTAHKS